MIELINNNSVIRAAPGFVVSAKKWWETRCQFSRWNRKKSPIQETKNLSTDVDSSTNFFVSASDQQIVIFSQME